MTSTDELLSLYANTSKHSNYQILAKRVRAALGDAVIDVKSRYEEERLNYMLSQVNVAGKSVLDIGGNSGFFSFELLDAGAGSVHHVEGNAEHSNFVKVAAEALAEQRLEATNEYFSFDGRHERQYDIVLLLNVLHHLGDDYDSAEIGMEKAKTKMLEQLNGMRSVTDTLIFQMGYCWKGNRNKLLFERGTKREMIDFITEGTRGHWKVEAVGIPVYTSSEAITYQPPSSENLERDDAMGEFLNRPLFILRA